MNKRIFYSEYFYEKGSKDTDVLERNANEYPYSSLASFLLLYHYKKTSNPAFEKFAKKTALLFNNPHWLQFQLFDKSALISEEEIINDGNAGQVNRITTIDNNKIALENFSEENVMQASAANFNQEIISEENLQQDNAVATANNEMSLENSSEEYIMEELGVITEESVLNGADVEEIKEANSESIVESQDEEPIEHKSEKQEYSEELVLSNSSQANETIENENILNETPVTIETASENVIVEKVDVKDEIAANEIEPITFEPLHAVDYFASQGIKITDELLANDKLGSQMKSFTAWLKSMKKLHPGKLEEQSLAAEKLIQASANESNFNTEILTEAMAEVLIKQDKKEKAIEMFSKLSLINPAKSAYFAARIESIKSS